MGRTPFWDRNLDGYEGPDYSAELWECVTLGPLQFPGIARAKAIPRRKFDQKKTVGLDGNVWTFHGYDGCTVEIDVTIWTKSHLELLDQMAARFWKPVSKTHPPDAYDISYPGLKQLGIKSVGLVSWPTLTPGPVIGSMVTKISALEWTGQKSKKKVTKTPLKSYARTTAATEGGANNFTTADGKNVQLTPKNAKPTTPSTSPGFTGPNMSLPRT